MRNCAMKFATPTAMSTLCMMSMGHVSFPLSCRDNIWTRHGRANMYANPHMAPENLQCLERIRIITFLQSTVKSCGFTVIFTVRNEVAKVMFYRRVSVHTGGYLPQFMLGYHPPPRSRHPPEQIPPSRHPHPPPGADTPQEQTPPWEQTPPQADTPREQTPPQDQTPPGADAHGAKTPPPGETATAADGTHPTGMHSCCVQTRLVHMSGLT